jgi:hypothetical protein
MDMKKQINMCIFMSMIFLLMEIKFDIHINKDELLIIIWEHNKKENCDLYCIATWSPSLLMDKHDPKQLISMDWILVGSI